MNNKTRKIMLIVNPYSGRGLSKAALGTIVSNLCEAGTGNIVTVFFSHENTPEELAQSFGDKYDLIVCAGGDGTLSGVISGLMKSEFKIPVGYIPAGTANDVANTLSLSKDPATASSKIIKGTTRPLDIGKFSSENIPSKYFSYIAAFGAFTGVSYQTPQSTKRAWGHFAYIFGGIADMAAIKPRHIIVEYDGEVIEGDYIFGGVANTTSIAGIVRLNPERIDLSDGKFEVILVKQPVGFFDFLKIMSSVTAKTYDGDSVIMIHASNITFIFDDEVAWTVDGEDGGKHKKVEINNCKKAVEVIVYNELKILPEE